jgi:branched-chain amino acid transport system substrate-binding protein
MYYEEEEAMTKKYLVLFATFLIASLALFACGGGAQAPEACAENPNETVCAVIEEGSTIKIGFAGPMTGDYSAFGIDISNAGQVAVEDAGEFEGFSFELLIEDTQGSGEGGASVANLYVSDPNVVAIAGHTFSGSTAAAIPIYNEARLPMLSASATRADLTGGDQDVFNRIPFTDDIQGTKVAEYLFNNLGFTKIAVMHDGDAYGKGLAEKVQEVFTGLGGEVVAFEAITPAETDYSAVLTDVGAKGPEAIFYGGYYPEAAVIAKDMPVAGLADVVLFSDDGTFGLTFLELAGENAEGVYATSAIPPESEARTDFDAKYMAAFGDEPGALSTFTWHGYDVVAALISAIESVAVKGGDGNLYIPREALVDAVNGLTGYQGLTGEISCSAGECNTAGPTFLVVENGEWVLAP